MNKNRFLLMISILVLASLACQALSGGDNGDTNAPESNEENPSSSSQGDSYTDKNDESNDGEGSSSAEFVMTNDAYNVLDIGDGSVLYYTKLSADDVMEFYRDQLSAKGYIERELLTVVSDGVFSMVFDGDPSGKSIVIQSVDLGDGSRTVTIRLEDV